MRPETKPSDSPLRWREVGAQVTAYADLKLTDMIVKEKLKAGVPYDVTFKYDGDASTVREVCFLWNNEGPYCWKDLRVNKGKKTISTKAKTGNPNRYKLSGFVRHSDGITNQVSKTIFVNK